MHEVPRTREVAADLNLVFSHGTALHNILQNQVLPALGEILYGQWRCLLCGKLVGCSDGKPMLDCIIPRPDRCLSCGGGGFLYEEVSLRSDQYHLTGHPDGFLKLPGYEGFGVLEAKSISQRGAWEVKKTPKMDHVIQSQMYMWFTGTQWAQILYWDKGTFGVSGLIEHHVERDDETIENILQNIDELWDCLSVFKTTGTKKLPDRICVNAECPRAKVCAVAKHCFAEVQ